VKQQLLPGGSIDALTPEEFDRRLAALLEKFSSDEDVVRGSEVVKLDAAGHGIVQAYVVPQGMKFNLHRVAVNADGYTPGAPFTNAAGYIDILRGGVRQDFFPLSAAAGGMPAVWAQGGDAAIRYRNGEAVEIEIVGGPPSTGVRVEIQGDLSPLTVT
jgi:hypothetical protein